MDTRHRVGFVGTGSIAPHHAAALKALPHVELIGVTDLDQGRAAAFAEKVGTRAFPSLHALRDAGVDAIHVLTPPDSHADVAVAALGLGCHVLVEKPLATRVDDCLRVEAAARSAGRVASVNHSLLFDPQIVRALDAVRSGRLGEIVSLDILRGSAYPPFGSGPLPPQYRSAAYPFRDLGVHALYLFQAFLGPIEGVSGIRESRGGDPNLVFDEWRALVRCRRGLGQFQLSWNVKPMQSQLILQGTRGVLRVDLFLMFQAMRKAMPVPKSIERVTNALTDSVQPLVDVPWGVLKFATGRVKPYQGLRDLIAAFYESLEGARSVPVSLPDATNLVRWVEHVAGAAEEDHSARIARLPCADHADILVTGASGGLGGAVMRRLAEGRRVRVFLRRVPAQLPAGVDVVLGDLGDPEAVDRAIRGVGAVVHVGAAMKGGWEDHERATVAGTRNVVEACKRHGVKKLVHVSSMSVNDWAGSDRGIMSEASPYEPRPKERGHYTRAKLEAERVVRAAVADRCLPAVILRPGQIFGGTMPLITPAVARRAGHRWIVLGDGELELPLVYLDDVVDAIVRALEGPLAGGEVIQIVDPHRVTQNQVLASVLPQNARIVHVPRSLLLVAGKLSELPLGLLGRTSPIAAYRLKSALARLRFSSDLAQQSLGWQPRVGVVEGIRRSAGATAAPGAPAT